VSIQPAEFSNWNEARAEMMVEAKKPLKAQLTAELGASSSDEATEQIRAAYEAREKALEHEIDHKVMDVHLELGVSYNCARLARVPCARSRAHPCPPSARSPFQVRSRRAGKDGENGTRCRGRREEAGRSLKAVKK
tara:strand:+ start:271 stop:678 length:408 start_codon:yes stop_codon:yes gene_type:complete